MQILSTEGYMNTDHVYAFIFLSTVGQQKAKGFKFLLL